MRRAWWIVLAVVSGLLAYASLMGCIFLGGDLAFVSYVNFIIFILVTGGATFKASEKA